MSPGVCTYKVEILYTYLTGLQFNKSTVPCTVLKICGIEINIGHGPCPPWANNLALLLESWYFSWVFKAFIFAQETQCLSTTPTPTTSLPGKVCVWHWEPGKVYSYWQTATAQYSSGTLEESTEELAPSQKHPPHYSMCPNILSHLSSKASLR